MTNLVEKVTEKLDEVSESFAVVTQEISSMKDDIKVLKKRSKNPSYLDDREGVYGNPNAGRNILVDRDGSTEERQDSLIRYVRTGNMDDYQKRGLSTTVGEDGGVTVEPFLSQMMDKVAIDLNPIAQNATIVDIADSKSYRKLVSTGGAEALRRLELSDRSETSTPKLKEVTINLFELSAYPSMTNELLSSSSFDIMDWVLTESGEAFAAKENIEFLTGTGDADGQAQGILTYGQSLDSDANRVFGELQYQEAASNSAIAPDELINLIYSLKAAYRANAKWYMSTEALRVVRSLKDTAGKYLWTDSLAAGQAPTLAGYPVVEVAAMSGLAPSSIPIMFGDMKRAYYAVNNISHRAMIVDRVTQPGWTKLFVAKMSGGGLVDSNALKLLRLPT